MNKKEKMHKDIEDALKHEDNLQHDENEDPMTYVTTKAAKLLKHEDDVIHDKNDDPITFTEENDDKTEWN